MARKRIYHKALEQRLIGYFKKNTTSSIRQCARDFSITPQTLYVWIKKHDALNKAVNPAGRKTKLTAAVREKILHATAQGKSLAAIAKKLKLSPMTLYSWKKKMPELASQLKEAQQIAADNLVGEMLEIADDTSKDTLEDKRTGRNFPNAANVARASLRIKTRAKMASYYNPDEYSDFSHSSSGAGVNISCENVTFMGLNITPPKEEEGKEVIIKELESFEKPDEPDNNQ